MAARTKAAKPAVASAEDFEPDAYCIRACAADGASHNGFRWPLEVGAIVTCADWLPTAECGNGLHGLIDGVGDWALIDFGGDRIAQVIGIRRDEAVAIDGDKVKFPRGKIAYSGSAAGAMAFIQPHMVASILALAKGNTTTGYRGHAAATGKNSIAASLGRFGSATAADDGWLVLAAYDDDWNVTNVRAAKVGGPEGIWPNVAYTLTAAGEFEAA